MRKRPYSSRVRLITIFISLMLPILTLGQLHHALVVEAKPMVQQAPSGDSIPINRWPDLTVEGEAGTWGDLNNDGWLDLIVRRDDRMILLFNQGKGINGTPIFAEIELEQGIHYFVHDLDLVDINGDGYLDFSVAIGPEQAYLFINPGENSSDPQSWRMETMDVPEGTFAISMAWGDMNGDGKLDLAIANDSGDSNVGAQNQLFLNESTTETITLTPTLTEIFTSKLQSNEAAWVDVDQDGRLDLTFSQGGRSGLGTTVESPPIELCLNKTENGDAPNFECTLLGDGLLAPTDFAWANIDQDSELEIAIGTALFDYEDATLTPITQISAPFWQASDINLGDVDNDGDLDFVVGFELNQPARIYVNDGGEFDRFWETADTTSTNYTRLADIDNDGDLDLTLTAANGTRIYLNRGGMPENPQQTITFAQEPYPTAMSLAWGDVDSDGDLDLAVGNAVFCDFEIGLNTYQRQFNGTTKNVYCFSDYMARQQENEWWPYTNTLYINNDGQLQPSTIWQGSNSTTTSLAWGDVNGDGLLDLVVGNRATAVSQEVGNNEVYLHQGGAQNGLANTPLFFGRDDAITTKIALADSDGDGDLDVVVANANIPNALYLNDGQGNFELSNQWQPEDANSVDIAWGDIDLDGALDLAVLDENGYVAVYRNEGSRGIGNQPIQKIAVGDSQSIAWGDMDGDGDPDLAVGGRSNVVLRNDFGRLQTTPSWQSADSDSRLTQIAWGDLNGDGYLDLLSANHDTSFSSIGKVNRFYLNDNGVLNRIPSWQSEEKSNFASLALGDVNSDGLLDIVFGNGRMWPTNSGYGYGAEYITNGASRSEAEIGD